LAFFRSDPRSLDRGLNLSDETATQGQLGVAAVSAERFKTDIALMGSNTAKLEQLRPVTFKLKSEPHGAVQYGLIAEEIAKVYPELVVRDKNGRIDGVRYDELAPMLLNELQKQQKAAAAQTAEIQDLKKVVVEMQAGLLKLQAKDGLVAQR
jgi:Chaperone of endosialidase